MVLLSGNPSILYPEKMIRDPGPAGKAENRVNGW